MIYENLQLKPVNTTFDERDPVNYITYKFDKQRIKI